MSASRDSQIVEIGWREGHNGRVAARKLSDEERDDFASKHLRYEVRMLVCHARALLRDYPNRLPDDEEFGFPHHAYDALLEAWLVHLRLLDEFLEAKKRSRDRVNARHWLGQSWSSEGFLKEPEVRAVNSQVAHLGRGRRSPKGWAVQELTTKACESLVAFCEEVEQKYGGAYEPVRDARDFAEKFLNDRLGPDDCSRKPVRFDR